MVHSFSSIFPFLFLCSFATVSGFCPQFQYLKDSTTNTCAACPSGYYTTSVNTESKCRSCPGGYYFSYKRTGDNYCRYCPSGRFAYAGLTDCKSCPKGHFSSSSRVSSCKLCPTGYYQDNCGYRSCKGCLINTYSKSGCSKCTADVDIAGICLETTTCPTSSSSSNYNSGLDNAWIIGPIVGPLVFIVVLAVMCVIRRRAIRARMNMMNNVRITTNTVSGASTAIPMSTNNYNGNYPTPVVRTSQNIATAQPVNAQPVNAQPVNAQPVNAQPVNAQPVNAQPVNAMPVNAQPVNAMPVNAQPVNAQPINVANTETEHIK